MFRKRDPLTAYEADVMVLEAYARYFLGETDEHVRLVRELWKSRNGQIALTGFGVGALTMWAQEMGVSPRELIKGIVAERLAMGAS